MQNRMLRSPDVHFDRQPRLHFFYIGEFFVIFRVGVTQIIPTGTDKGVHRVCFPFRRPAASWAFDVDEFLRPRQRRPAFIDRQIILDVRQFYRQVFFGNGNPAGIQQFSRGKLFAVKRFYPLFARGAKHQRNRRAPVPLPRNQPVAELVIHFFVSKPPLRQPFNDFFPPLFGFKAGEFSGSNKAAVFFKRLLQNRAFRLRVKFANHLLYRQFEFSGEFKIPLIVRRHRHYRAGAVMPENVIGGKNRNFLAVSRIDGVNPLQFHAGFFFRQFGSLQFRFLFRLFYIFFYFFIILNFRFVILDYRVFRRHHQIGAAENRVQSCRKHSDSRF